jgi:DNA-binding NtrC family response regulator
MHARASDRTRLHVLALSSTASAPVSGAHAQLVDSTLAPDPSQALLRLALTLKRFDVCILPVASACLAWARLALLSTRQTLDTPVLALMHEIRAPAIADLLQLGVADFIYTGACHQELRARLTRLTYRVRGSQALGRILGEPVIGYGISAPSYARPSQAPCAVNLGQLRPRALRWVNESFRQAKARVIDGFERDYIRRALACHAGNVAQAARASDKHRRAFWALMRKHQIEAAAYRENTQDSALLDDT